MTKKTKIKRKMTKREALRRLLIIANAVDNQRFLDDKESEAYNILLDHYVECDGQLRKS